MSEAPLLAYYGDDLTGSTDVMEALSLAGIETVLFTRVPGEAERARFSSAKAVGIAGTSRSQTPDWMDAHLPAAFEALGATGAPLVHYKVCSTFDSAPQVGSIGRAAEIGRRVFGDRPVPLLVGAPQLKRYTAFGHLFAAFRGETFRIDRHPVMSRHPVTPMDEADLRLHLARQTDLCVALVDLAALAADEGAAASEAALAADAGMILIDVADPRSQRIAGRRLEALVERGCRFVVGSSGVEYALFEPPAERPTFAPLARVDRIAVVSGSVSPTTERQIRHAEANGFTLVALDPRALVAGDTAATERSVAQASAALRQGRSVVVHTALGPAGDLGAAIPLSARNAIGRGLGAIEARLVREANLPRAVIAGGDTSSHALEALGALALTVRLPFPETPGSPVCRTHRADPAEPEIEVAMKGGQVGGDDYFVRLLGGTH